MNKSTFLFTAIIFAFFVNSFAQCKADEKLEIAFGFEKVNDMELNFPDSVLYYNFICTTGAGFEIIQSNFLTADERGKIEGTIDVGNQIQFLTVKNQMNLFNILLLDRSYYSYTNAKRYYSIVGTELILVIPASDYIAKKFEGYSSYHKTTKN